MIPSNSNNKAGCDPISSNCVIWQGPDLSCVEVCNGDTVSDVVANLCNRLIAMEAEDGTSLDLSTIDKSTLDGTTSTTLTELIQQIIDNLATESAKADNSGLTCTEASLCESNLPECLQKNAGGSLVLGTSAYLEFLGTEVCNVVNDLSQLTKGAVTANTNNITQLQSDQYETPKIYTSSIGTPSSLQSIDTVLQKFELEYSLLKNALNTPTALYGGVSAQGEMLPLDPAGWQGTYNFAPTTVSHTIENLWSVIKDLRSTVTTLEGLVVAPASNVYPLMGGSGNTYAGQLYSCSDAEDESQSATVYNIYNETGIVFDTSVRAFTDAAATTEIAHGLWYVISGTTTVARYSTIAPHWKDIMHDADTNAACT
jgi:hypothetical protein